MPAFVDLHAHFRDPFLYEKGSPFPPETLESAALSAAAGGFGTVVCMANTKPAIDTFEKAAAIKKRSDDLGLVDLYPVLSLTKNLDGKELSEIGLFQEDLFEKGYIPLMLSEDGKDLADDDLFLSAMKAAQRIPVSCHCDFGGEEAEAAKKAGLGRNVWSRIEENNAVRRVIELGKKAGCRVHIAHVSTKEAVETIRRAKLSSQNDSSFEFALTCEAMPHNLCLTEADAEKLGAESWGRVNPPLRSEEDRKALIQAVADGTVDAIATDHAPHSGADKKAGVPGFSGFETAFAAVYTELVRNGPVIDLKRLSSLMSANPARLLGLYDCRQKRGRILPGYRADLVMVDTEASRSVDASTFKTRRKNSPFAGRLLFGQILMTLHSGQIVFSY
jgi:dihydroorotase